MMSLNESTRINNYKHCCVFCGKGYKNRSNMDKHIILCELLNKSRKSVDKNNEEEIELPTQKKLFFMLLELGQKYNKLEEKVEELNKWVVKKKKKINVLEWLNINVTPDITFENISDKINIVYSDIDLFFQSNFFDTLHAIFSRTLFDFSENDKSIFTFVQKANIFYIYDLLGSDSYGWVELSREKLIRFLNKIQMKISKSLLEWKKANIDRLRNDDLLSMTYDKTVVKLMSIEFKQESTLSKVKNMIYNKMKTDIKTLIEYEFEF